MRTFGDESDKDWDYLNKERKAEIERKCKISFTGPSNAELEAALKNGNYSEKTGKTKSMEITQEGVTIIAHSSRQPAITKGDITLSTSIPSRP